MLFSMLLATRRADNSISNEWPVYLSLEKLDICSNWLKALFASTSSSRQEHGKFCPSTFPLIEIKAKIVAHDFAFAYGRING